VPHDVSSLSPLDTGPDWLPPAPAAGSGSFPAQGQWPPASPPPPPAFHAPPAVPPVGPPRAAAVGRDRARGVTAALTVAMVVALLLGNVALWLSRDVYSTANIAAEARTIVASPDVKKAVTDLLVTRVVDPAVKQANPAGSIPILGGIATVELDKLAAQVVRRAVSTQSAQAISTRLVEAVVPQLQRGAGPVTLTPEELARIVAPGLAANTAVSTVLRSADRSNCCSVALAQRHELSFAWRNVGAVRAAAKVLPVVAVAFGALSLVVSRRRRHQGMVVGAATAGVGLVTLVGLRVGARSWIDATTGTTPLTAVVRAAETSVVRTAGRGLQAQSWLLVALGLVIGIGIAVVGRRRAPRAPGVLLPGA